MRDDGMEESVQFVRGYNCEARGPRSHGVHGMEIWWYLRGPLGGAQFRLSTDWIPGQLSPGHGLSPDGTCGCMHRSLVTGRLEQYWPSGADVGYHARVPQWEEQEPIHDDCPVIGGVCYYDGSGMRAHHLAREFVELGEHVIWAELEKVYADIRA